MAGAAGAQTRWRASVLHPEGAYESFAYAVDGGMQGGFVDPADSQDFGFPALWFGSPDSLVNLLPAGNWDRGSVSAMDGGRQVGRVLAGNSAAHAALWYGTADSFVDLHPGGFRGSGAVDTSGAQVVGAAAPNGSGYEHAVVWNLTDRTLADLHPVGARWSQALATDGRWQGGEAQFPDLGYAIHAVLWSGSAESATDLNPFGAKTSTINDMAAGVQVGDAQVGSQHIAVLWRGTPESAIDMTPDGVMNAHLYATTGDLHGGSVRYSGQWAHAALWFGDDPNDFISLHDAIPGNWKSSEIYSLSVVGETIYAAGAAIPDGLGTARAVTWTGTIPAPGPAGVAGVAGVLGASRRPRRAARRRCPHTSR